MTTPDPTEVADRTGRTVRLSCAMSLDGYIAGPHGEFDWIPVDPDIDMAALFAGYDTILVGRKSYEAARGQEGPSAFDSMKTYVFSRTLSQADHPDVTVSDDPVETVVALKAEPGKDIWLFGGGELFAGFLKLGLVDEVQVAIVPVLLGEGLPLLPSPAARARLRLRSHRLYDKTGTLLLDYEVV